jgi:hypothetical protein
MSDEPKKPPTDTRRFQSTEELAYARMFSGGMPEGLPDDQVGQSGQIIRAQLPVGQREERDRQIADCMKGVVADARRSNPVTGGTPLPTVTPMGAGRVAGEPRGNGWHTAPPLGPAGGSMSQALVDGLVQSFQPHGVGNKERPGKKE